MQSQYKYSLKDDVDIKFSLTYIKIMQNTAEGKISLIDEKTLLTKVIIGKQELDISIRKIWVL